MIKSVVILFEIEISVVVYTINKLCDKYLIFYSFKNLKYFVIIVVVNAENSSSSKHVCDSTDLFTPIHHRVFGINRCLLF